MLTKNTFDVPTFRGFKCALMGMNPVDNAVLDEGGPAKRKTHDLIDEASLRSSLVAARAYAMNSHPDLFVH